METNKIIDLFAAIASGMTVLFVLGVLFSAIFYLLYVGARLLDMLLF